MEVENAIFKEANVKLPAAMKNKDFKEISVAQAMIEAAQKRSAVLTLVCRKGAAKTSFKTKAKYNKHSQASPHFLLSYFKALSDDPAGVELTISGVAARCSTARATGTRLQHYGI